MLCCSTLWVIIMNTWCHFFLFVFQLVQSTYCSTMAKHYATIKKTVHVINLDPAAEAFDYDVLAGELSCLIMKFWYFLVCFTPIMSQYWFPCQDSEAVYSLISAYLQISVNWSVSKMPWRTRLWNSAQTEDSYFAWSEFHIFCFLKINLEEFMLRIFVSVIWWMISLSLLMCVLLLVYSLCFQILCSEFWLVRWSPGWTWRWLHPLWLPRFQNFVKIPNCINYAYLLPH